MLEIRDLHVSYGGIRALAGLDLDVKQGSVVSILGANGAGKSTLLNTLMNVAGGTTTGTIRFCGRDIQGTPTDRIVTAGLAMSPEGRQLFGQLTVEENLRLGAYLRRDSAGMDQDIESVFARFPRLKERRRQVAATLSGGEQQMVSIGRALMSRPQLLLLDEPSLGLSPLFVQEIMALVGQIASDGVTVLLVEQNARQALKISDYAYVVEKGVLQMHGPASDLLRDDRVVSAYLGGATH